MISTLFPTGLVLVTLVVTTVTAERQTFDGYGNNLKHRDFGKIGTTMDFIFASPDYGDDLATPAGSNLQSARNISTMLYNQPFQYAKHGGNDLLPYFGQFICHDIAAVNDDPAEVFDIPVPACDATLDPDCFGNQTIEFRRSYGEANSYGQRAQRNDATSWVDAGVVYGVTREIADALRTFEDGLLKVSSGPTGDLLPLNDDVGLAMAGPAERNLFAAGDHRANVNLPMICLHTLFHLEHNRKARDLKLENPDWNDEELYEEARKFVIALLQKELFDHYIPLVIGRPLPNYQGYDDTIDPAIDVTFMTSAFRYGHSTTSFTVYRMDEDFAPLSEGHLDIGDTIFNPLEIHNNGMDNLLRGFVMQPEANADLNMPFALRNHDLLVDLGAKDIQRNRDRGVKKLNDVRESLGMRRFKSFADLTPHADVQRALEATYGHINDVELYVGGLAERPILAGVVPPTFAKLIELQFTRLRDADRFYYENNDALNAATLAEVRDRTLSKMVLDFTLIDDISNDMFQLIKLNKDALECDTDSSLGNGNQLGQWNQIASFEDVQLKLKYEAEKASVVSFQVTMPADRHWFAVGFDTSKMENADAMVVVRVADGEYQVKDIWIGSAHKEPEEDSSYGGDDNMISAVSASVSGSLVTVEFDRQLVAADEKDHSIRDATLSFVMATGATTWPSYHGTAKTTFSTDMGPAAWGLTPSEGGGGAPSVSPSKGPTAPVLHSGYSKTFVIHACTMVVMWMFFVPWSALIARHFRTWKYSLEMHQTLSQTGAFGVIWYAVTSVFVNGSSSKNLHTKNGVIIVSWMVFVITVGWILRYTLTSVQSELKSILFYKRLHKLNGWAIMVFAIYNCWVGMNLLLPDSSTLHILFGCYAALLGLVVVVLEVKFNLATFELKLNHSLPEVSINRYLQMLKAGQCVFVIRDCVCDVSTFIKMHPGGISTLQSVFGIDASHEIDTFHKHSNPANEKLSKLYIGRVPKEFRLFDKPKDGGTQGVTKQRTSRVSQASRLLMQRLGSATISRIRNSSTGSSETGRNSAETSHAVVINEMKLHTNMLNLKPAATRKYNMKYCTIKRLDVLHTNTTNRNKLVRLVIDLDNKLVKTHKRGSLLGFANSIRRSGSTHSSEAIAPDDGGRASSSNRFSSRMSTSEGVSELASGSEPKIQHMYPGVYIYLGLSDGVTPLLRAYTPLTTKIVNGEIEFFIRVYANGKFTNRLQGLQVGSRIRYLGPLGENLVRSAAAEGHESGFWPHVVLISGGTGISPCLQVISHYLDNVPAYNKITREAMLPPAECSVKLLACFHDEEENYANNSVEMYEMDSDIFEAHFAYSVPKNPEKVRASKRQHIGRASLKMISSMGFPAASKLSTNDIKFIIAGNNDFIHHVQDILCNDMRFDSSTIHALGQSVRGEEESL